MVECACGCGESFPEKDRWGRPRKFISGHNGQKYPHVADPKKAARKRWRAKNADWVKDDKRTRHRRLKVKAIHHMGGQCEDCGRKYDGKNGTAFEFHHKDPKTKSFGVGNQLLNKSWKSVLLELKKCKLLCSLCHNKHHGGEW